MRITFYLMDREQFSVVAEAVPRIGEAVVADSEAGHHLVGFVEDVRWSFTESKFVTKASVYLNPEPRRRA